MKTGYVFFLLPTLSFFFFFLDSDDGVGGGNGI